MEQCEELFLNEVTHVELVPTSVCALPVPFSVGEQTVMEDCTIGTAAMVIDWKHEGADGEMLPPASLKTAEKPQKAGYVRQHDLQVPIRYGYETIRKKRGILCGVDFHVILRTLYGTEFLLYALPNSSMVSVEDQFGGDSKQTVRISLKSMSNMIRITRKQATPTVQDDT